MTYEIRISIPLASRERRNRNGCPVLNLDPMKCDTDTTVSITQVKRLLRENPSSAIFDHHGKNVRVCNIGCLKKRTRAGRYDRVTIAADGSLHFWASPMPREYADAAARLVREPRFCQGGLVNPR